MTKVYGDFYDFGRFWARKNKAKQSQFMLAPSTAVGLKKQSQSPAYGRNSEIRHELKWCDLKKQSQFAKGKMPK